MVPMKILNALFFPLLICSSVFFSCSKSDRNSALAVPADSVTASTGVFTTKQAERGAVLYTSNCASCHGSDLRGTEGGNALIGQLFRVKWEEKTLRDLFELTKSTMPKTNPHSLDDPSYSSLLAFILNGNGFPSGSDDLPSTIG